MKNIFRILAVAAVALLLTTESAWAGNDERRGTAGATQMLVNPWARSAGWGSVNIANVRGIESFFNNIAGLAFVTKTEFAYSNTLLNGGKSGLTGVGNINAFGLAQRISDQGVLGAYVMASSFGNIDVTTEESPEAGYNGTFSPSLMTLNVAYAHSFSNAIHGGVNLKIINETTDNLSASGFAIDAGIQYVYGADDELKFGISLKNIGSTMSYGGTGLSISTVINDNDFTVESRAAEMELPTCLNIGVSYDFLLEAMDQRITVAGGFTSNAFLKDNFTLGLEYSLLNRFQARVGYVAQSGIFNNSTRTTANSGLCAGASFEIPMSKKDGKNQSIVIDYSYRAADPLRGTHSIGATIKL